jgi:hypothetical protein
MARRLVYRRCNSTPEGPWLALQVIAFFDDFRKYATSKNRMACEQGWVFVGAAGFYRSGGPVIFRLNF